MRRNVRQRVCCFPPAHCLLPTRAAAYLVGVSTGDWAPAVSGAGPTYLRHAACGLLWQAMWCCSPRTLGWHRLPAAEQTAPRNEPRCMCLCVPPAWEWVVLGYPGYYQVLTKSGMDCSETLHLKGTSAQNAGRLKINEEAQIQ